MVSGWRNGGKENRDSGCTREQRGKTRYWLDRYHFVLSTLALGLKINFDQPIKWMEFQKLEEKTSILSPNTVLHSLHYSQESLRHVCFLQFSLTLSGHCTLMSTSSDRPLFSVKITCNAESNQRTDIVLIT